MYSIGPTPRPQNDDACGKEDGLLDIMSDKNHCRTADIPQDMQLFHQSASCHRIQGRERFIQQKQKGISDDGPSQGDTHGHAAGKRMGALAGMIGKPDLGQGLVSTLQGLVCTQSAQFQRKGGVGAGICPWHEGRALKHKPRATWRDPALSPALGCFKPGQKTQQAGFARARGSHHGDDLSL
jgi:hypothetical protein